jgi:hypothetical protein
MQGIRKLGWTAVSVGLLMGCSGGDAPGPQATPGPSAPSAVSPLQQEVQHNTKSLEASVKAALPAPSAPNNQDGSAAASVAGQPAAGLQAGPVELSSDVAILQKMIAGTAQGQPAGSGAGSSGGK